MRGLQHHKEIEKCRQGDHQGNWQENPLRKAQLDNYFVPNQSDGAKNCARSFRSWRLLFITACFFPLFLNAAAATNSALERFKLTICSYFSSFYWTNSFLKPLNPILGETLQGYFTARFQNRLLVSADDVTAVLGNPDAVLVDSRAADRYRGENETIDPLAGHIPSAVSAPFAETIAADGTLKPPLLLKEHFHRRGIGAERQPIFYCGSGVTAAQNILAYVRAGLGMPRLYAGSWSDWITDPARPVATGSEPGTLHP